MKRIIRIALLSLCVLPFFITGNATAGLFGDTGKKKIEDILRSPALSSVNTGVKAVSLTSGKTLVDINGGKLFIPASNVKLVTAYCALKTLTPQFTFPTEFLADTAVDSGTVNTLYIRGYGDPTVTLADLNLQAMALSETLAGIRGDIVIDNSYFDGLQFGQGWMWDEGIVPWNAPISPYAVNGNCIDIVVRPGASPGTTAQARTLPATRYAIIVASVTTVINGDAIDIRREETPAGDRFTVTGTIAASSGEKKWRCTVSRPGLYAGTLFAELLARYGVTVTGGVSEGTAPSTAIRINNYESRSLGTVVRTFLKDSDNLYGECILKALGAATGSAPGTADKGIAAIGRVLKDLGIAPGTYRLADGSGLSTYNLLSPALLTRLLQSSYQEFSFFPEFMDALSIAGTDGTLKNRFRESPLARIVRAKTGTMSGVSCISGYLKTRRGNLLAVSIMMNGCTGTAKPYQNAQDEIVKTLWETY